MPSTGHGSFTRAGSVYDRMPYPGFTNVEILAVESALRLAWTESAKRFRCHQINFSHANEDDISSALVLILDDIWAHDRHLLTGLSDYFHPVPEFNSQHGAFDYLGKALTLRPDLTFRRAYIPPGLSTLNGCLFVEAKLIEPDKTMGKYCGDGLIRFVNGKYAWAVPQAMMLGYLRETSQALPDSLAAHLRRYGKQEKYHPTDGPRAFARSRFAQRAYLTTHDRTWPYPGTDRSPGPITVFHVWLRVIPMSTP